MTLEKASVRTLVALAPPRAFADNTVPILARLGYRIVLCDAPPGSGAEPRGAPPDLYLVDERRLGEVEQLPGEVAVPLVVLTGRDGVTGADARVLGAVKRPAGLHDLFRVLQQIFEETPRAIPRAPTHLSARCRRSGQEWSGALLSLSENGCLLRSPEPLPLGSLMQLSFDLPGAGEIRITAETAYQLLPDVGLVFNAVAPSVRGAIRDFVSGALLSAAGGAGEGGQGRIAG